MNAKKCKKIRKMVRTALLNCEEIMPGTKYITETGQHVLHPFCERGLEKAARKDPRSEDL